MKNLRLLFFASILIIFVKTNSYGIETAEISKRIDSHQIDSKVISKPELKIHKPAKERKGKKFLSRLISPTKSGSKKGMAIAGFVLSLVGLFVLPATCGILAVIFSSIGLSRAYKSPETNGGKGMAIAGLIIGLLDIAYALIVVL